MKEYLKYLMSIILGYLIANFLYKNFSDDLIIISLKN